MWRDRFEEKLDRRQMSERQNLEALSAHLSEFHYQKFDEIDVPGQYLLVSCLFLKSRQISGADILLHYSTKTRMPILLRLKDFYPRSTLLEFKVYAIVGLRYVDLILEHIRLPFSILQLDTAVERRESRSYCVFSTGMLQWLLKLFDKY